MYCVCWVKKLDYEKIISKLKEYKKDLEDLKNEHHDQGSKKKRAIHDKIVMFVRRIYPNPDTVLKKIFPQFGFAVGTDDDSYWQKRYIDSLEDEIRAVDTIIEEYELFGFDNFEPIKKQVEDEFQLGGRDLLKFSRKTKK